MNLENKNVITLGAGSSGRAAAALAVSAGADVAIHDSCDTISDLPKGVRGLPMQQQLPEMRVAVTCWLFPQGLMATATLCNLTSSTRVR